MDKAPHNPLDGPILDPDRLPYGIRLGPLPPSAAGHMLWMNGAYLGFVPCPDTPTSSPPAARPASSPS